jgi:hypothetical protein
VGTFDFNCRVAHAAEDGAFFADITHFRATRRPSFTTVLGRNYR